MARLKVKPGVLPRSFHIIAAVLEAADAVGIPEITITSGIDGKHMATSYHYTGSAIDVRSKTLTPAQKTKLVTKLRTANPHYDVLIESVGKINEHIHIEEPRG